MKRQNIALLKTQGVEIDSVGAGSQKFWFYHKQDMNMKFKTLHILGNWNMHLYTQFSFLSRIECEKHWERIRNQETGECFFSHWCLNLSVIFIKENLSHKIKKNKIMKLKFWKTKREGSRRIDMYTLSRIVSQFAKSSSMDTAVMNLA